jgi:anti-sigma factor RsiW
MAADGWIEKLDAYLDGELPASEARAVNAHLKGCPECSAEALRKVQQKRAVQAASQRFAPDLALRARIQRNVASQSPALWNRRWLPVLGAAAAFAMLLFATAFLLNYRHDRGSEQQFLSELVDQHVATLASSNPVDVVSTDRHTVKPWFEGKIPFTFNLPDLQDSPFTLVGGRLSYMRQSPGAELIFRVRQHQISVFIFQEQQMRGASQSEDIRNALSFGVRNWRHAGLLYFVIGDASPQDLDKLSELIKAAG